jgi:hypothetical protein
VLATTFLGHQGWLVQGADAAVLFDPLLCDDFGAAHALEYRVWPPRAIDFAAFPPLDAVVLSHEHDDHFDLPSLAKLDRAIPVYLSARSSRAAREILAAMGFAVHALVPGAPVRFGDLEVVPFAGDHVSVNCGDEWDTLPYLVKSTAGHGSFFSMVDITLTQRHVEWAAAHAMKPGLVSWTNNALDWSHMAGYLEERVEGTQQCFVKMGVGHKLISTIWGTPQAMITCAGGFSFTGERAWLNQRVFCVDTEQVCALMQNVYKKEKFFSGVPGQTWTLRGGKLAKVDADAPWLRALPRESWPSRAKAATDARDYAPATGRRDLDDAELARLRARLGELAGALVGGMVFRGLVSLLASEADGRRTTFALALRRGDGRVVVEYDASTCAFGDGAADPERAYVAGLECWASDLLAVLDGALGPIALTFGRARVWNALPSRLAFDIFEELYRVSHPLRRPDAYLATYQRLLAPVRDTQPVVLARR